MGEYYAVTRSPEYLEHFGILGMKWGVRRFQNKDGSLTPEGIERYRKNNQKQAGKLKEEYEKMFNWRNRDEKNIDKMFNMTGASDEILKEIKDISKKYANELDAMAKESDTLFKDFDSETRTFYEATSELAEHALINSKDPKDLDMEEVAWAGFMGCLEDGQQQSVNASSMYANEKGITDSCVKLSEEYHNAYKDYHDAARELTSKAFEEVGADIQIYDKNPDYKLGKGVADNHGYAIENNHEGKHFYQALEGSYKFDDSEKKAISSAKDIISRLDGNKDYNTWWYVNEAAENLGLSSTKAGDMTQADWDRINAEIRKLRSIEHSAFRDEEFLAHHGILGMKWGVRRFQNPDGSLTEEGRRRYGDILTKDQMNNLIKSYNLRTGKKKKINKNTIFKTPNGTYDYKGRRINTDTEVDDPGKKKDKDTKPKKLSEMSDAELAAANARMKAETEYNKYYKELNPQKESLAKKFMNNTIDSMTEEVPKAVAKAAGDYLRKWITGEIDSATSDKDQSGKKNQNQDQQTDSKKNQQSNKSGNQQSNKSDNQQSSDSDKQPDSKESPTKSVSGMNVAGIKIPNATELGNKVGRVEDLIRDGLNDYQADFNKAKDKASNYTKEKRRSMADTAVTNLEKSIKGTLDPSGRAAVNRALSGVLRNASGSEYNKQSTFDSIVKDAYYNQVALEFMSDFGLKSLDQIRNY